MTEAVARDRVKVSVKCTDRDRGLVMHRIKDMDMFHLDRDFNVSVWAYGQPSTAEPETYACYCHVSMLWTVDHGTYVSLYSNICCEDVALAYIDGRRRMLCSLLGGHGGAQLVAEEPSLSRRSPARHGGAQLVAEEPSPKEYGDAASDDRVCLALPRLCDPDPVAPAFGVFFLSA
ncbi:hypothetical protein Syun_009515 [Stephania yunnanensis]|uniref:Uncharacterized protein n=1 Tax=Stephania yunnanensis TaxID=152371 RepID=A0AAP0KEK9_9MAGN